MRRSENESVMMIIGTFAPKKKGFWRHSFSMRQQRLDVCVALFDPDVLSVAFGIGFRTPKRLQRINNMPAQCDPSRKPTRNRLCTYIFVHIFGEALAKWCVFVCVCDSIEYRQGALERYRFEVVGFVVLMVNIRRL